MKLKGWPGASLVLFFSLAGTVALFFYGDYLKIESYQKLRDQLGTLELQNVEKEKGRQVKEAAQAAVRQLNRFIDQAKIQAETIADAKALRRSHTGVVQRNAKKREFLKLVKPRLNWSSGLLTDEKGKTLVFTGIKPEASIAATPAFKLASCQRLTAMALEAAGPDKIHLKVTIPCLTDRGIFLGVLQAEIPVTSESYQPQSAPGGILVLIGTSQGRRLTPGPQEDFPDDLDVLWGKSLREMQELNQRPAEGTGYFKVRWEDTEYLLGSASLQLTQNKLFALLEITELAKVIGLPAVSSPLFSDPLILGGLALILVLGMVFMMLLGGGAPEGIKQINQALDEMQNETERLVPLALSGSGEWGKLTAAINFLINKVNATKVTAPAERIETDETEQLTHLNRELIELRQTHDQALAKNMELEGTVEELAGQYRELKQNMPPPENTGQLEELKAEHKAAGRIRIEAVNSISEDLKAMLLVIKNYISRILSSEEGKITDKEQEFLGEVINKSARLERLISDLLDIAYLEGEASQIVLTPTDIAALLEDVVLNIQAQADSKQIQLIQEMPPSLTPVMAHSERLGQVFAGLVQQALKLTPAGREVRIMAAETLSDLVIKIRDNGPPIRPGESEKVFSVFHGPESPAGTGIVGTGLRFAIIKCILDIHHGTVAIRGLAEQGNETVVTLPKGAVNPEAAGAIESGQLPEEKDEDKKEEKYYDLSALMEQPEENQGAGSPKLAETGEDLDKLLNDIDNIDDKMNR